MWVYACAGARNCVCLVFVWLYAIVRVLWSVLACGVYVRMRVRVYVYKSLSECADWNVRVNVVCWHTFPSIFSWTLEWKKGVCVFKYTFVCRGETCDVSWARYCYCTPSVECTAHDVFPLLCAGRATHCNALQRTATHCNTRDTLQLTESHRQALQHIATHATHCNVRWSTTYFVQVWNSE